jgi:hypothetical protein
VTAPAFDPYALRAEEITVATVFGLFLTMRG